MSALLDTVVEQVRQPPRGPAVRDPVLAQRIAALMACLQRIEAKVDRYLEKQRQEGLIRFVTTDR